MLSIDSISHAEVRIDINQGKIAPIPIALTDIQAANHDSELASMGQQITKVVGADLKNCGLFAPADPKSFIQDVHDLKNGIQFADWRVLNVQALMRGQIVREHDGRLKVEFRLYDVFTQKQMEGLVFHTDEKNWRRVAHKIADAIYKRLTGEQGYFDTKIVYVAAFGYGKNRKTRLAVMDQDGANQAFLTDGKDLVITPRFSPNMQQITYLDYAQLKPRVYVMDIRSQRKQMVGNFPGMTFSPRFSPDGNTVVMSFARGGNTSIFTMNLKSRQILRLTNKRVIDTSPCYSPDGSKIVFNSDRGGRTQLYVMENNGNNIERISFGKGSYRTPVWSPRGDMIAFTKLFRGEFFIGVMNADGSGERLLTKGFLVEGPSWSPNGRVIMFTREDHPGKPKLCTIDLTGYNERVLPTKTNATYGSWSPAL